MSVRIDLYEIVRAWRLVNFKEHNFLQNQIEMKAYVLGYACLIIWGLASPTQEGRLFFFSLYFENLCSKI